MPPLAHELEVAREAALQAGALILRYHKTDVVVDRKAGDEPVTRADREASDLIVDALRRAFPADLIVSEEATGDLSLVASAPRIWFIDPLDGTRDFIRGHTGFAVMIGLCEAGRPCLGAVYQPTGERLFLAVRGQGATLESPEGRGPLRCSEVADLTRIRLVASKSHRTGKIDEVKGALGIADELNVGSVGLKLGLIALAERDLYVNPSSKSSAWDTCAPEAILLEAGGRITDLEGQPLRYDREELKNDRGLIASNGIVHDEVVAKLASLFRRKT